MKIVRALVLGASLFLAPAALAAPQLEPAYSTTLVVRQNVTAANAKVDAAIATLLAAKDAMARTRARTALADALKALDLRAKEWNDDWVTRGKQLSADLQKAKDSLALAKTDGDKSSLKVRVESLNKQLGVLKLGNKEWNDDWLAPKVKSDTEVVAASDALVAAKTEVERAAAITKLDAAYKARAPLGTMLKTFRDNW